MELNLCQLNSVNVLLHITWTIILGKFCKKKPVWCKYFPFPYEIWAENNKKSYFLSYRRLLVVGFSGVFVPTRWLIPSRSTQRPGVWWSRLLWLLPVLLLDRWRVERSTRFSILFPPWGFLPFLKICQSTSNRNTVLRKSSWSVW